jgi:site-specific DNA recombinase
MHAIAYLRVSTDEQAKTGSSLPAQQAEVVAYCLARGLGLADVDIHSDEGISGKSTRGRDGLAAALEAACGTKGVLVVYSLSRMARSVRDSYTILDRLTKSGARLESVSERLDLATAAGRLQFGILVVINQYKVEETAEQTAATLRDKASKGERTGGLRLGSRVIDDGRRSKRGRPNAIVECHAERIAIVLIHTLHRDGGLGPRPIARRFTNSGRLARNGKPWSESTIRGVLKRKKASP